MDGFDAAGVLEAFGRECAAAEATLATAADADPDAPALGDWSLGQLVAHLVGVAGRIARLEVVDEPVDAPFDAVAYYEAPGAPPGRRITDPQSPPASWARRMAAEADASVARVRELEPSAVLRSPKGPVGATDYLATRVLEVTIHHLDVCRALDVPPATTPEGGRLTSALLEGLLHGPRPRNLGRTRFLLAATGRIPGPDDRFPVLR